MKVGCPKSANQRVLIPMVGVALPTTDQQGIRVEVGDGFERKHIKPCSDGKFFLLAGRKFPKVRDPNF